MSNPGSHMVWMPTQESGWGLFWGVPPGVSCKSEMAASTPGVICFPWWPGLSWNRGGFLMHGCLESCGSDKTRQSAVAMQQLGQRGMSCPPEMVVSRRVNVTCVPCTEIVRLAQCADGIPQIPCLSFRVGIPLLPVPCTRGGHADRVEGVVLLILCSLEAAGKGNGTTSSSLLHFDLPLPGSWERAGMPWVVQ